MVLNVILIQLIKLVYVEIKFVVIILHQLVIFNVMNF